MNYVNLVQGQQTSKVHIQNIYCVARNYVDHARELGNEVPGEMTAFLKPNSCLINKGQSIVIPTYAAEVHHEGEIVVLMGKKTGILAVAAGLDITARDVQSELKRKGLPWLKAKGFYSAAAVSDFILVDEGIDLKNTKIEVFVNGQRRQSDSSALMIRSIEEIVRELDLAYHLQEGDLVFTGTPKGVGLIQREDSIIVRLMHIHVESTRRRTVTTETELCAAKFEIV